MGQSHLALTDHGTVAGALHHLVACEAAGVTPIVGMEAYFKPDRTIKDVEHKRRWHTVLLAQNATGWTNLIRLSSEAHRTGFYYSACADWDLFERHSEGLIALTACVSGPLPDLIVREGRNKDVDEYLDRMQRIFGDRLAVEIMPHDFDAQRAVNVELVNIANERGIPYVATVDAHYPFEDWADTQDILLMINTRQTVQERQAKRERGEDVYTFGAKTLFLMDESRLKQEFARHHPELPADVVNRAIQNTGLVASWIQPFTVSKKDKLPRVSTDEDPQLGDRIVAEWCREGMDAKGLAGKPEYEERLEYELGVLRDKGVMDYFVIIGDLVKWARSVGIRIGIGRGSAAGCLVSYLIGITGLDPITHGLLFERFLNPHRKGMPDIDLDFQHDRRHEVKDYLAKRWGESHIAEIGAYQRFALKNALKDVAKVLCVPYEDLNRCLKAMEGAEMGTKLEQMRAMSPEVDAFAKLHPECWKHAVRLEGQTKTLSKHPAGVLVTDKPVTEYMPMIRRDTSGELVTAWTESVDFKVISGYGFMKIDVLGIDGLTVQDRTLKMIKERHGVDVDLDNLPVFSDPNAGDINVLQGFNGSTLGVFQFESRGIRGLLRQINPDHFNDIVAANALYRPGPLVGGVAHSYGARKNHKERWSFWHPAVEPFLGETYGLIVYQEQVMQIVQALGDFSMAEADDIRKAMTKLHAERVDVDDGAGGTKKISAGEVEMQKHEGKFLAGCAGKGISVADAREIWDKIVQFSVYGFNKSHSAGYAAEAYKDMWLKLNYPLEQYCSLLTEEPKKVPDLIREARGRGISVLPPDVNTSHIGFSIDNDAIRYGLGAIKFVGDAAIQEIAMVREEGGPFSDYDDFVARVSTRRCNKRVKEALLNAGAFDSLGGRQDMPDTEKRTYEFDLLGTVLSVREESPYKSILAERVDTRNVFETRADGEGVVVGGEITNVTRRTTKKGDLMANVDIRHGEDDFSIVVFPRQFAQAAPILVPGEVILVKGTKDSNRDQIIFDAACTAEQLKVALEEYGA